MTLDVPNPLEPAAAPDFVAASTAAPSPVAAGPVRANAGISNRALNALLGGALVLAVAGVAFAAGRMTAPAQAITAGAIPGGGVFNGNGPGQLGNGGQVRPGGNAQGGIGLFGNGAGPTIEGTVESITDTTLTLKTADGQTIQIALDGDTSYHAQTDASAGDVVTGSTVLVRLDFGRIDGGTGPSATAGTGGASRGMTANDVTVVP